METISFKLSKKLNDLGLLDNIETKFVTNLSSVYYNNEVRFVDTENPNSAMYGRGKPYWCLEYIKGHKQEGRIYKTLTLEEVIEFLPKEITIKDYFNMSEYSIKKGFLQIEYFDNIWTIYYRNKNNILESLIKGCSSKTLLEALEKMIEYLIKNNLIKK